MADSTPQKISEFLRARFADEIIREEDFRDQQSFLIEKDSLLDICRALIDHPEADMKLLCDITCVDWLDHEEQEHGRFEVIYNLYSITHHYRLLLKVRVDGDKPQLPSVIGLWNGANWLEREVWDLFGVFFDGHPDMTKILTPDDLEGHPLRRDYPLTWEQPRFTWNKDEPPEVIK
jgi:NADH-quinone oxidoreductase subunit C